MKKPKPHLWVLYMAIFAVLMIECNHALEDKEVVRFNSLVANPLCDFLIGEDAGGVWTIVSIPAGSTLTNADLVGDCPSIDFDLFGCGEYVLRYTVESTTCNNCEDSTDIIINKCCLTGSATCN